MKSYSHLTSLERQKIEDRLVVHKSIRWIAGQLGRSPSTISREIKRNKTRGVLGYDAQKADIKSYQRRWRIQKQTKKIRYSSSLEYMIRKFLKEGWTAEKISMRLEHEYHYKLSGLTIRRYIESKFGYDIKQYLIEEGHLRRYRSKKYGSTRGIIKHRTMIDMRPMYASNQRTMGHYECDFIESKKGDKTVILRLIDKYNKFRIAHKLSHKGAELVKKTLLYYIRKYNITSVRDKITTYRKRLAVG